ncbi:hypothetical protein HDU81_008667 [Chytriomyces hyalinus]|nr:hypothetical protein HDU81_008667 [Chytriomyces hyalinus]
MLPDAFLAIFLLALLTATAVAQDPTSWHSLHPGDPCPETATPANIASYCRVDPLVHKHMILKCNVDNNVLEFFTLCPGLRDPATFTECTLGTDVSTCHAPISGGLEAGEATDAKVATEKRADVPSDWEDGSSALQESGKLPETEPTVEGSDVYVEENGPSSSFNMALDGLVTDNTTVLATTTDEQSNGDTLSTHPPTENSSMSESNNPTSDPKVVNDNAQHSANSTNPQPSELPVSNDVVRGSGIQNPEAGTPNPPASDSSGNAVPIAEIQTAQESPDMNASAEIPSSDVSLPTSQSEAVQGSSGQAAVEAQTSAIAESSEGENSNLGGHENSTEATLSGNVGPHNSIKGAGLENPASDASGNVTESSANEKNLVSGTVLGPAGSTNQEQAIVGPTDSAVSAQVETLTPPVPGAVQITVVKTHDSIIDDSAGVVGEIQSTQISVQKVQDKTLIEAVVLPISSASVIESVAKQVDPAIENLPAQESGQASPPTTMPGNGVQGSSASVDEPILPKLDEPDLASVSFDIHTQEVSTPDVIPGQTELTLEQEPPAPSSIFPHEMLSQEAEQPHFEGTPSEGNDSKAADNGPETQPATTQENGGVTIVSESSKNIPPAVAQVPVAVASNEANDDKLQHVKASSLSPDTEKSNGGTVGGASCSKNGAYDCESGGKAISVCSAGVWVGIPCDSGNNCKMIGGFPYCV